MKNLQKTDSQIYELIKEEEKRQRDVLEMIPSENYASKAVMEAMGSVLGNKYSEGFIGRRYYQGNAVIDKIESLVSERAKKLFNVPYANVQPLSGSPANAIVYYATLNYGDKIMGLNLAYGGHITHGHPLGFSGRFFKSVHYALGEDEKLDYEAIEKMAIAEKPQILICGYTAYPRVIDFKRFSDIADKVGCYLMADISHISGLVVTGVHPSPSKYAHIITTTTHKTLRGPRGAIVMVTEKGLKKNPDIIKKIETSIIPGLQGGPHDNQTAAIGVALREAQGKPFKKYAQQIVNNCRALATELLKYDFDLVSGGTDNHLILIDMRNKKVSGRLAAFGLEKANIVANFNGIPGDNMPPLYPSGVRIGTAAITTRGMKEKDMAKIGKWYAEVIDELKGMELPAGKEGAKKRSELLKQYKEKINKNKNLEKIAKEVKEFCQKFPVP